MKPLSCLYVPIGVPTFHMPSAQAEFEKSVALLQTYEPGVIVPDKMLLTIPDLQAYLENKQPDLIILQNITFANSAYATEVFKRFDVPILLWTLSEPVIDGNRLRLNSLTGAFSAGFAYQAMHARPLHYTIGATDDESVKTTLNTVIQAAKVKKALESVNLLMIGHTPQGFGFGRALDLEMANTFGVNLLAIESRELTQVAKSLTLDDIKEESKLAHDHLVNLNKTPDKNRLDFIKLFKAYKDYIDTNNIHAIASRCWPDFFTDYGTPVCGVLGLLNDAKIAAACEADAYGALSMLIGQMLSNSATYLGDPVSIDKTENTITFWHCGTSACSLAHPKTGATVGVHPNRQIGPTMEFGLKAARNGTIFRIGRKPDGSFRFFIQSCEILDKPQQFFGTSVVTRIKQPVETLISTLVKEGFEPHYVVVYDSIEKQLIALAEMLNLEVCKY